MNKMKNPMNEILVRMPVALLMAYGTISFVLLDPNVAAWPAGVRVFFMCATAYLGFMACLLKSFAGYAGFFLSVFIVAWLVISFFVFDLNVRNWNVGLRFGCIWGAETLACILSTPLFKKDEKRVFASSMDGILYFFFPRFMCLCVGILTTLVLGE